MSWAYGGTNLTDGICFIRNKPKYFTNVECAAKAMADAYNVQMNMGCFLSWKCPSCKVQCYADTSKAGKREGNVYYVAGPCCCLMRTCPLCGYSAGFEVINKMKKQTNYYVVNIYLDDVKIGEVLKRISYLDGLMSKVEYGVQYGDHEQYEWTDDPDEATIFDTNKFIKLDDAIYEVGERLFQMEIED